MNESATIFRAGKKPRTVLAAVNSDVRATRRLCHVCPCLSNFIYIYMCVGSCLNYGIKRLEERKITTHSLTKPRFV